MTVSLLESYFDFFYAKAILEETLRTTKKKCDGCRVESLSQRHHTCLSRTTREQLEIYFEDILLYVDENDILSKWEDAVSLIEDNALVGLYRLKIYSRDWRKTDMKSAEWKSKMIKMTRQLLGLHIRFNTFSETGS
jgi:predicted nucleotidyltransferase